MAALNLTSPVADAIYAAYERSQEAQDSPTLRASELGDECERRLWYRLHWAIPPKKWDGRMLRLFETGNREEDRVIANLRAIGCMVALQQEAIAPMLGGWLTGHIDGVVCMVPDAEKTPHLLEVKTHNMASFRALRSHGVAKTKPRHMMQMQIYMHGMSLTRALYIAVCKDNDDIYCERVHADPVAAAQFIAKAERILQSQEAPPRISEKPEWFECKMCDFRGICHGEDMARRNCRTCAHYWMTAQGDQYAQCELKLEELDRDAEARGCSSHVYIPSLVNAEQIDANQERGTITYRRKDGTMFVDGEKA